MGFEYLLAPLASVRGCAAQTLVRHPGELSRFLEINLAGLESFRHISRELEQRKILSDEAVYRDSA
jgi:hypothetical protein